MINTQSIRYAHEAFETEDSDTQKQGQWKTILVVGKECCDNNIQFLWFARPEVQQGNILCSIAWF